MAPYLLHNVIIANKDKFCLLKNLGKVRMGSTTGANKYFYLNRMKIDEFKIPINYLYPMTKSPKEWTNLFTPKQKNSFFLLYITENINNIPSIELQNYIEKIRENILSRPFFKNKSNENWYRIPLLIPDLLLPNMIYKRSFIPYNKNKYHIDKQWIGFWSNNEEWIFPLLAFLNSSLGILLREIQGTKTLGLGSLKISLKEYNNLIVLDPRKIPKSIILQLNEILKKFQSLEITELNNISNYSRMQELIDYTIIVEYFKMKKSDIKKIHECINFETQWRLSKHQNEH
jgi:hypothetical protein